MSVQEHLLQTAKMELTCCEGRVKVNFSHDLGGVAEPLPQTNHVQRPGYSEVLKKNIPSSQFNRLQKRAAARAEEAKIQAVNHHKAAEQAKRDAEKSKLETLKQTKVAEEARTNVEVAKTEALESKNVATKALRDAAEANIMAEEAKAQLEALKVDYDAQYTKAKTEVKCEHCEFKFESHAIMKDHIKEVHHYPCSVCAIVCKTQKQLKRHWSAGETYPFPVCEFCDQDEPTCELLFTHIDRKHKNANRYHHPFKPLSYR